MKTEQDIGSMSRDELFERIQAEFQKMTDFAPNYDTIQYCFDTLHQNYPGDITLHRKDEKLKVHIVDLINFLKGANWMPVGTQEAFAKVAVCLLIIEQILRELKPEPEPEPGPGQDPVQSLNKA